MRVIGIVLIAIAWLVPASSFGQMTRVATFENFVEGDFFKPTLFDPHSAITFRNSTNSSGGFSIDYSSTLFGGSTFLTAGIWVPGLGGATAGSFGFTADLPQPANRVSLVAEWGGVLPAMTLRGFNSAGQLVTQQQGPASGPNPFLFEITSGQYDITRFVMAVGLNDVAYDNISYTVLPEPGGAIVLCGTALSFGLFGRRRACGR